MEAIKTLKRFTAELRDAGTVLGVPTLRLETAGPYILKSSISLPGDETALKLSPASCCCLSSEPNLRFSFLLSGLVLF